MERIKLKGGSLAGTYHCIDKGFSFIRKQVSLTENREFGFYRWFSQLKKLQRLGRMFPELFPKVIGIGLEGGMSYFDLEFIENSVTVHEFLTKNPSPKDVERLFSELVRTMDILHSVKMPSFVGGFELYIDQEVSHALSFCMDEPAFRQFAEHKKIVFNGKEIPSLLHRIEEFQKLAAKHYVKPEECLTHGNITLENLLYVPSKNRIVFIDLYEENYIDTVWNDYSQIAQSSNSLYELYNKKTPIVKRNSVTAEVEYSPGLAAFNKLFQKFLQDKLTPDERVLTSLYEVSQFTRMLPFKKTIAKDKMILFYALASELFDQITKHD
ncbi:MAG: hypothetical protein UX89_C0001G0018 [Parcubacteria group bacterium GW2011_GWA2_47_16]|nr:MAG: hypothetical protein UX89_C0001G0018 [Parcubacteria group bacterium GW2011_GWA2_47_16]